MFDALTLDGPRRDNAGNMVASVLAARVGIQDYAGFEVGKPDMARVVVYRPAEEVFHRDSMRTYAGAPVTIDHPKESVNPTNWKDHAVGEVDSGDIVKDGEAIRVPFLLRDAAAIDTVLAGKREISMGYECSLDWTPGKTADGKSYDAVQRGIRINHLAIVDRARGGPTLRIGDQEKPTMKIKIGDAEVEVTDGAAVAVAVGTLNATLADERAKRTAAEGTVTARDAAIVERDATIVARDADVARLTAALADANDPAKRALRDAALRDAMGRAKALGVTVTDAMLLADVQKAVVTAKMPEKAATYDATAFGIAFDSLTAGVKVAASTVQPIGAPMTVDAAKDANDARATMIADMLNPTAAKAA